MYNPYEAPKSDLDHGISEPRSKKGWKIFFWFIAPIYLLFSVATYFIPIENYSSMDLVTDLVIYPVVILGIFGFAYDKRFISAGFWKVWLLVAIISDAYSLFDVSENDAVDTSGAGGEVYVLLAIFLFILIFQYVGLYNYAYNSPEIWSKQVDNNEKADN